MDEFASLTEDQTAIPGRRIRVLPAGHRRQILIPVIRDTERRFEQDTYPQILTQMSSWAQQERSSGSDIVIREDPSNMSLKNRFR